METQGLAPSPGREEVDTRDSLGGLQICGL